MRTSLSSSEPRSPRRLAAVAVFTALCLGSSQALAQAPAAATPPIDRTRAAEAPLSVEVPPELAPPPAPATEPGLAPPTPPPDPNLAPPPPTDPNLAPPPPDAPPPDAPPPPDVVGPTPPPAPLDIPGPVDPVGGEKLRKGGIGTMLGGGVLAALGFGMTLAFTIQGRKRQDELVLAEDQRQKDDCSRDGSKACTALATQIKDLNSQMDSANRNTQVGGAIMLTGFVVMAVGGLVYRMGIRKLQGPALGRVKVSPSLGGVVLSGRF